MMTSGSRSDPSVSTADFPRFVPRAPWWGGDLQTLRSSLIRERDSVSGYRPERLYLSLRDGSDDRLVATVNVPKTTLRQRPLVMLVHGVTGSESSPYVTGTAAHCLALGFPVVRLNLRGAGPSRPLCRRQYHAGQTDDLRDAIASLPMELTSGGIVAVGYSLGANLLLKFLGECGRAAPLLAAVAVSAPLDLAATAERLRQRRNFVYHRQLLKHMRYQTLAAGVALTVAERLAVETARSLWQFDNDFTAPRNGFAGADDYYARNSCGGFLDRIAVPTLVIQALDDPIVPAASYRTYAWDRNRKLVPLLTRYGGHVGFAGKDSRVAWYDLCTAQFLDAL
jgi:predicted alpha/beta-fold hydrolase